MSDRTLLDPAGAPRVIVEISANHLGDKRRFLDLIRVAADAGAAFVKFQTYTPETMTLDVDLPQFRVSADHELWGGRGLFDLYGEAQTPWEWHEEGIALARDLGVEPFSSPFDASAVDFLEQFDPVAYKIASLEVVDIPLIQYAASKGRPLIISSGAATESEVEAALVAAQSAGAPQVVLLKCTSAYPATPDDANLASIPAWREKFGVPIGLSDHTLGTTVSVVAASMGAQLIERHVTLSRADGGPDGEFSLEPAELARLVSEVDIAWRSVGVAGAPPADAEQESLRLRRSLWVSQDVSAGDVVTSDNVKSLRPAGGLPPLALPQLLGARFVRAAVKGTPLSWELVDEDESEVIRRA